MKRLRLQAALVVAVLAGAGAPARAQHMNLAGAPCRKAGSNAEMTQCFYLAWQRADGDLTQIYDRVRTHVSGAEASGLVKAQRAWARYRDATCDAEYALYAGGSGGSTARFACLEAVTRGRIADLHVTYDWRLEN